MRIGGRKVQATAEEQMTGSSRSAGDLHSDERSTRAVGGFIVTEGSYAPALKIHRHDHELASICVVLNGGYEERFGCSVRRCDPGAVIVHPQGEHHAETHDPVRARLLTIEIEDRRLRELKPVVRTFDQPWHRIDYSLSASAYALCAEIANSDDASALAMESSILEMISTLESDRMAGTNAAAWLHHVRDRLDAEFQRPPNMKALAELAGVHPVHLARAFRRRFRCSIGAYVRRLQVGRAALLLEDHSIPLSMVACESGFADQSHMTRLVRDHTGLTPGSWRRRARGKVLSRSN
jgi:AraC family transcriptional regulator